MEHTSATMRAIMSSCAAAMYGGRDFMGQSAGDVAEALQYVANVLGIKGPYAVLSEMAQELRQ